MGATLAKRARRYTREPAAALPRCGQRGPVAQRIPTRAAGVLRRSEGPWRTLMLSIIDIARRIEAGGLSPHEAVRQSFDAIAARDGYVKAFVHVDRGAEVADSGPLRGIAVGVKDIVDTADMPTEMGSTIYAGWRPKADASIVAMLRHAGAVPVGKTTTTAFAHLDPTPTRNPANLNHTPGGSSS